jgi:hypothetical protein
MGALDGSAWTVRVITADTRVFTGPGEWGGLVLLTSAVGTGVNFRDGLDAGLGKNLGTFVSTTVDSLPIIFLHPIPIDTGLFIDVGTNVTSVMVIYREGE